MIIKIFISFLLLAGMGNHALAGTSRTIYCSTKSPSNIYVPFNDVMTIEFPEKPKTSLPGNGSFDFKFIDNDLAVKSLVPNAKANLFVYLNSDKCVFRIITSMQSADEIVKVKYPKEATVEAKYVK